jgi:hypothetical protein
VLKCLADRFDKVVAGSPWEDELPLPWRQGSLPRTRIAQRDLEIFCEVANALLGPNPPLVGRAIADAANRHHIGYKTAEKAWNRGSNKHPLDGLKKAPNSEPKK